MQQGGVSIIIYFTQHLSVDSEIIIIKPKRVWDRMETLSSEFGETTGGNYK